LAKPWHRERRAPGQADPFAAGRVERVGEHSSWSEIPQLFGLNPAQQIVSTHRLQQGRMIAGHVPPDGSYHLVVGLPAGDVSAFAPDRLSHRTSHSALAEQRTATILGVTPAAPPQVRIQICGPLAIEVDGQRIDARLPGRQGRLLVTYLVLNRHRQLSRGELAEALWLEPDPAAMDTRLNPLLSKLRRIFGPRSLEGRATIRLCLPAPWVDLEAATDAIHRAESAVAQKEWGRAWGPALTALLVSERDFLAGEDAPWIDDTRNQLALLRWRALECYAAAGFAIGGTELAAAVRAGRQLTSLAPFRESGYRYLMEALAAQGNLAEALLVYTQLSDCLRDQLGVSPSPATRELYQRLLAAT
jgi:DNA-binding SARP family transcriptional activator